MAAAVFIPPSPHDPFSNMATASRRAPLASIPNATNSPHRFLTTSGSKRSRAQASVPQQENEPPNKRQAVEKNSIDPSPAASRRQLQANPAEGRVFERGNGESGPTAFQRKLVAARDKNSGMRVTKNVEQTQKDETIRQWQKHYRKLFPGFSFYFDSVAEDVRSRYVRHISALGAKEERFFSKSVTHIITTRPIPVDSEPNRSSDSSGSAPLSAIDDHPQTINPSLLEKNSALNVQGRNQQALPVKRDGPNNLDILARGRQMGMKIWAVEKLHRVLSSILEDVASHPHHARGLSHTTRGQPDDLSQVLRNEKLGAAERDQANVTRELVLFKGPFLYIHDMDERVRPTMVRDYPKPARRQDGEWPQFRSASVGKCPFVEDLAMKREIEQERAKHKALLMQQQKEAQAVPRTRSTLYLEPQKMEPPRREASRKALHEVHNAPAPPPATINPGVLSKAPSSRAESQFSFPPMPDRQTFEFARPAQLFMPREPAASGIQRSNLTSAIQSQMISSTAATGVKAGTSREVHELKRKVLERTHTGSMSVGSIPSSHRMNDLAGALKNSRGPAPQRAAKSKAQEKLGGIHEENDAYIDDIAAEKATETAMKKRKPVKRDPRPGYCENCRDKYEDFDEHIVSRKHRKFALTLSNWTELDALLAKLQRP